uniref:G-protein coupled receptors family 2 profile 2 domain-containing protein n=1 Tax=Grammatophora oceanica TaxID=210454 RepID=A0A6U5MQS0_9STRA|mmetsp:Transcript_39461/g.58594  ORF Transcript_39461/g.58594 Transcript_39461/m.58594 type:complete len:463 (+) Transcript_39461:73-1461(+)|eukprot:CAMPEP_0194048020 /NCGR_PEP_ID=MMETSP0009_2-20130614/26556_1 /TAXON_ID=210454 /ORGANISM="Grammatophora oceanica, Strain CCMP 410" /LENGTH=462 /DNA_ID=CAMNT_0038693803 /DNA_START=73 /DNA_END=1461 /DNA_ORIENTATION=-
MGFTQTEFLILAIIPKVSAVLSTAGSVWILVEVFTDRKKVTNVYHRLLTAMSIYDILESSWNFASNWALPVGTPNTWYTFGTQATCTAQGFFLQFGVGIPIYNGCLALYYLLIVRYGIRDERMKKWIEPSMHLFAFVVAFGTAIAGVPLDLYNPDDVPMCWIKNNPIGCTETWQSTPENPANCVRGDNSSLYRFAFYLSWVWGSIFSAIVATVLLYLTVRGLEKKTTRYTNPSRSSIRAGWSKNKDTEQPSSNFVSLEQQGTDRSESSEGYTQGSSTSGRQASSLVQSVRATLRKMVSRGEQDRNENPRSRQVFNQAVWYIAAFFLTHIFACIQQVIFFAGGTPPFWMIAIHMFCDPGQGFYNFLVYRRPRYIYIRNKNPELSRFQCLRLALRWSFRGPVDVTTGRDRKVTTINDAVADQEYDSFHDCDDDYQDKFDSEEESPPEEEQAPRNIEPTNSGRFG